MRKLLASRLPNSMFALPFATVVALGLGLRLWGIDFGLPFTYASDEPTYLTVMLNMLRDGDLNPHWWLYPSLMFYINLIPLGFLFLAGWTQGWFASLSDIPYPEIVTMGVGKLSLPAEFLVTRGTSALFSAGGIILVYAIAQRITRSKWASLLAALLYALSPTTVDYAHRINPDILALFFSLLSFVFVIRIADEPRTRDYVLAGGAAGLAIASKYNAGLIIIPLIVVHVLEFGWSAWRRKEVYIAMAATAGAFVVAVPFSVLDFASFWEGARWQVFSYTTEGHAGQEGNALQWYLAFLWNVEGPASFVAVMGGLTCFLLRSKKTIALVIFPLSYLAFVSQMLIRNERTIMQIVPFLHILAVVFLVSIADWFARNGRSRGQIAVAGCALVSIWTLAQPLWTTWNADLRLTQVDGRETGRLWIESNIPAGSRIAEEAYAPYVDTSKYIVWGIDSIADREPDWYISNGFEYLVLSQGMFGRFVGNAQLYPAMAAKYNQFFETFPLVKRFDENDYQVRIYKTNVSLPNHRVGARFGDEANVIELVGYDVNTWGQGQPLRIKLYWRSLADQNQPLELELRVLDVREREIAKQRGDLFEGKGWSEGMFSTDWTIDVPQDAQSGAYRLEPAVIQSRYSYRAPATTWRGDKIDPIFLGPLVMKPLPPSQSEIQSARPAGIRFGKSIELLSYRPLAPSSRASSDLPLTLYWRSIEKPERDYTVFAHLLDAQGAVRAQIDVQPRGGTYPTSMWDQSELVRDDFVLKLPADLVAGDYRIELGLYEWPSLEKLPATAPDGHAIDHWVVPETVTISSQ